MLRMFDTHTVRRQRELSGFWDFFTVSEDGAAGRLRKMFVPSCWESCPDLGSYKGKAVYRRLVTTTARCVRLVFKGVGHTAQIYWDGALVGSHYNAYTQFDVLIREVPAGGHLLEVRVDNGYSAESALHIPNDYYSYGGITRPVAIEELDGAFIKNLSFDAAPVDGGWRADITATVETLCADRKDLQLTGELAGHVLNFESSDFCKFRVSLPVEAEPWSPDDPRLYTLSVQALQNGKIVDDLIERVGFRTIEVRGGEALLNNKKIFFKGYNRHEDFGATGNTVPIEIMNFDAEIILASGANFIRTAHYPNDERFLDICDERGILVWEEAHARGLDEAHLRNEHFTEQSRAGIEEMVVAHYNHPSIVIWGILNECASDTAFGRQCYGRQYAQLRELDTRRLVTAASDKVNRDICLDFPDIVSFNIYPRWSKNESPKETVQKLKQWLETTPGKGKPLFISEFGAGAVYGHHSLYQGFWSEEKQAEIIKEVLEACAEAEFICGAAVWQFCDNRVDNEWMTVRPKSQNNKGIVDIYRRPKLAYSAITQCFKRLF